MYDRWLQLWEMGDRSVALDLYRAAIRRGDDAVRDAVAYQVAVSGYAPAFRFAARSALARRAGSELDRLLDAAWRQHPAEQEHVASAIAELAAGYVPGSGTYKELWPEDPYVPVRRDSASGEAVDEGALIDDVSAVSSSMRGEFLFRARLRWCYEIALQARDTHAGLRCLYATHRDPASLYEAALQSRFSRTGAEGESAPPTGGMPLPAGMTRRVLNVLCAVGVLITPGDHAFARRGDAPCRAAFEAARTYVQYRRRQYAELNAEELPDIAEAIHQHLHTQHGYMLFPVRGYRRVVSGVYVSLPGVAPPYEITVSDRAEEGAPETWLTALSRLFDGTLRGFTRMVFPLVRRAFGSLLANELVSVQPMNQPSGLQLYLDYEYSNRGAQGAVLGSPDEAEVVPPTPPAAPPMQDLVDRWGPLLGNGIPDLARVQMATLLQNQTDAILRAGVSLPERDEPIQRGDMTEREAYEQAIHAGAVHLLESFCARMWWELEYEEGGTVLYGETGPDEVAWMEEWSWETPEEYREGLLLAVQGAWRHRVSLESDPEGGDEWSGVT